MVMNSFEKRNLVKFFSFFGGRGWVRGIFLFFCLVFNVFSSCSQRILKFPTCSQIHSWRYSQYTSYLSHMVCPKFNSHVYKLKRWTVGEHSCFDFAKLGVQRGASIGACPMFQKNWWWPNWYGFLSFLKLWAHINMNHNSYPSTWLWPFLWRIQLTIGLSKIQ